jgi:hypothetical protein
MQELDHEECLNQERLAVMIKRLGELAFSSENIDNFLEWVVEAIDLWPMNEDAKVVVDAMIAYSRMLREQEQDIKQAARTLWDVDVHLK